MMLPINYAEVVQKKIINCEKQIGYSDRFKHYTLDNAWFERRKKDLQETGVTKLKAMMEKCEELGYKITRADVKDFGVIYLRAEREGSMLGGWCDPIGKLRLGLARTRSMALQITYRKKLTICDTMLGALLKDHGFRK